jgi:hypothetical protein
MKCRFEDGVMKNKDVELAKLKELFPCGHRKLDWDDGYGECVFCKIKQRADDYERLPRDVLACHDRIEELEAELDAAK